MRRPRPVALTDAERRALRVIEKALEEDPRLWVRFYELSQADRPQRRVRRITWGFVAVSVVVLVFGLVVAVPDAVGAGVTMLLCIPAVVLCAGKLVRWWP
jgi:hypothetical protein